MKDKIKRFDEGLSENKITIKVGDFCYGEFTGHKGTFVVYYVDIHTVKCHFIYSDSSVLRGPSKEEFSIRKWLEMLKLQ
ncbi:MAG: hypothetical protein MUF43_13240 [Flavobacterium sp.]|jgi:hypothetical protein|nr:hypothetical protein [Flavobacterium sp.]